MTVSFTGHPGDLVMALGSVDETGDWVLQAHPEGVGESLSRGVPFWTVAEGNDTRVSLWNPEEAAQALVLLVSYNTETGAGVYQYPIHLEAAESKTVSFQDLIAAQLPDIEGNVIPLEAERGRAVVAAASSIYDPIRVVVSAATLNLERGTCSWYCIYCAGYILLFADPSQLYLNAATGESALLRAKGQHSNGSVNNVTYGSTWHSDNTSVAYFAQEQVTAPDAQMIAVNPGTGAFSVTKSLQEFRSNYCFYNPTCGQLIRSFFAEGECNVLKLVITQPTLPAQNLQISTAPAMPQASVGARLLGWTGGSLNFNWKYEIEFLSDNGLIYKRIDGITNSVGDSADWNVPLAGQFFGGNVRLTATVSVSGKQFQNGGPIYNILGNQPGSATVRQYITRADVLGDVWFAERIARHESNYREFDADPGYPFPAANHDGGYGIFQLTPPSSAAQYWNWQANVNGGKAVLDDKETLATSAWNTRVSDWSAWNAEKPPEQQVPAPPDNTVGDTTFAFNPSVSEKSFRDAGWIKRFNGLGDGFDYIIWRNSPSPFDTNPRWEIRNGIQLWLDSQGEWVLDSTYCSGSNCRNYVELIATTQP